MNSRCLSTLTSVAILSATGLLAFTSPLRAKDSVTEARAIAKEAYIYGFPMVDSYRIEYGYFVDKTDPEYKGPWNEIHNTLSRNPNLNTQ